MQRKMKERGAHQTAPADRMPRLDTEKHAIHIQQFVISLSSSPFHPSMSDFAAFSSRDIDIVAGDRVTLETGVVCVRFCESLTQKS